MKLFFLSTFLFFLYSTCLAQNSLFHTYSDSNALKKDALEMAHRFIEDVEKLKPGYPLEVKIKLKTSPWLVYYGTDETVYYPFWGEVPPQVKQYFYKITGGEDTGKKLFGLFFNGFYLAHELGHYLDDKAGRMAQSYENEYLANTIAMLWWKKQGKQKELDACYQIVKSFLPNYPNPVPAGKDAKKWLRDNYFKILETGDAMSYGFFQFSQFVSVYEDTTLPDFDEFMRQFYAK